MTPFDNIAPYMRFTLEEQRMCQTLAEVGVEIVSHQHASRLRGRRCDAFLQIWSGAEQQRSFDGIAARHPARLGLRDLRRAATDQARLADAGIKGVFLIGDAEVPGMIAQSVFSGHRLGREIDSPDPSVATALHPRAPADRFGERRLLAGLVRHVHRRALGVPMQQTPFAPRYMPQDAECIEVNGYAAPHRRHRSGRGVPGDSRRVGVLDFSTL